MLSSLGNLLLFLNMAIGFLIIYLSFQELKAQQVNLTSKIYQLSLIQTTSITICFFTLISAFIVSDFSLVAVYQNSHSLKPLLYKISGTWGNHEGSLL